MRRFMVFGLALCGAGLTGCAASEPSVRMIAEMDALPAEKQLPNWASTRALMMRKPPKIGDMAPYFALKAREGDATTRLSQFRDDRPVVLIFGSWT